MRAPKVVIVNVVKKPKGKEETVFKMPDDSMARTLAANQYPLQVVKIGTDEKGVAKLVSTPLYVFREGEQYDEGLVQYIGGESKECLVRGFKNIVTTEMRHLDAAWFKPNDVLFFIIEASSPAE